MNFKRYLLPLGAALGALALGSPELAAEIGSAVNTTVPPDGGNPASWLGGLAALGPSGVSGFLAYQLDKRDKTAADAAKVFAEALAAKDKTIQDMASSYSERVEKFLEEAQSLREGESSRFHEVFDKLMGIALNGVWKAGGNGQG